MIQLAVMTRLRKPSANDNDDKAAPPGVPALIRTESRADRANQRRFQRGVDGAMAGAMLVVCIFHSSVGRCRLTVSKPELKARLVSALEGKM
jgi:hypothetical protein